MQIMLFFLSLVCYPAILLFHFFLFISGRIPFREMCEKCGFLRKIPQKNVRNHIWIHVSSVGEYRNITGFTDKLKKKYGLPVFLTYFNKDAAFHAETNFDIAHNQFMPFEFFPAYIRLIKKMKIKAIIVMETEIWPVLLASAAFCNVPVFLISACITDRAFLQYLRFIPFFRRIMKWYHSIFTQSSIDLDKFSMLGANPGKLYVAGNLKYDLILPAVPDVRAVKRKFHIDEDSWIFTAGSVHEQEDRMVIEELEKVFAKIQNICAVIAPRNLSSLPGFLSFLHRHQIYFVRRSQVPHQNILRYPLVYILDTIGELTDMYAISNFVFVGGSLIPHGGHNILEPLYYNKKTCTGPYTANFRDIMQSAKSKVEIINEYTLAESIIRHYNKPGKGDNGRQLITINAGVGNRILTDLQIPGAEPLPGYVSVMGKKKTTQPKKYTGSYTREKESVNTIKKTDKPADKAFDKTTDKAAQEV